jgi:hypothetical protein
MEVEMMQEEDHGLGIGPVEASKVLALEEAAYNVAKQAVALGMEFEVYTEFCTGAFDVASID